ncbi:MAG: stage II sporulation protein R [Clostridia bacterium]|nr:stage II sporulation protein R [Clostridia bacterium]
MKKLKINPKTFNLALLCAFACAMVLSFSNFNAVCDDLRQNVLRLHIIANSNSQTDQELKLKIRDSILAESETLFSKCENIDSAIISTKASTEEIENLVNEKIKKSGFSYNAKAFVEKRYFETREYDDFTLPAGEYESLVIEIGEAKGENWWCVIYPSICLPAATDASLSDSVNEISAETAEKKGEFVMRFKAVEIYEDIKSFFKDK